MFCVMNLEVIKKTAVRPRISWSCGSFNCFYVIYSANFKPASFASARMDALETFFPSYSTRSSVPPVKISVFAAFFRMMQSSWTVISRASFTSRFRLLQLDRKGDPSKLVQFSYNPCCFHNEIPPVLLYFANPIPLRSLT